MGPESSALNVTHLIDDAGINRFNLQLTIIAFLVVVVEGYDITALAFALPGLMADWHVTDAASLGLMLTASVVGMLIGSPIFGSLGDRFGRRWTTIVACAVFGFFTALVLVAGTVDQIIVLRLLAGLGLGGAAPNVIALVSEYAPTKRRAMMVTMMFSGIGLGGALPGILSSMQLPWHVLFWVGTCLALGMALVCLVWLPESAKYLVVRSRQPEAYRILRVLAPSRVPLTPQRLVLSQEPTVRGVGVTQLFRNGFAGMTVLFWITMAGNYMTFTGLQAWMPALLQISQFPHSQAAFALIMFQIGGVVGGLVLGRLLDRYGPSALAVLLVCAVPATIAIGQAAANGLTELLFAAEFAAGFFVLGTAYAFGAFSGMLYPTSIRANGSGWALALGRVGAIIGTIASGKLIGLGFGPGPFFLFAALPLAVGALACFGLAHCFRSRASAVFVAPSLAEVTGLPGVL